MRFGRAKMRWRRSKERVWWGQSRTLGLGFVGRVDSFGSAATWSLENPMVSVVGVSKGVNVVAESAP
jgi:hypothetical protein